MITKIVMTDVQMNRSSAVVMLRLSSMRKHPSSCLTPTTCRMPLQPSSGRVPCKKRPAVSLMQIIEIQLCCLYVSAFAPGWHAAFGNRTYSSVVQLDAPIIVTGLQLHLPKPWLRLGAAVCRSVCKRFPDSELYAEIEESVRGGDVYLVQPTGPPVDGNLMELLFLADACRRAGAARLTAVVPYFGYARQDSRARAGKRWAGV